MLFSFHLTNYPRQIIVYREVRIWKIKEKEIYEFIGDNGHDCLILSSAVVPQKSGSHDEKDWLLWWQLHPEKINRRARNTEISNCIRSIQHKIKTNRTNQNMKGRGGWVKFKAASDGLICRESVKPWVKAYIQSASEG